ncbi:MAG TPA: hypothetical protein VMT86_17050 [Bryobacteraceae bacterium]|nr:hypothetical protein [Bryobacteraceae bacterium]
MKLSRYALWCMNLWCLAAGAGAAWAQQYPFLPVAGAPKGVTILFQDSRGRLWLGGASTACFDGTRFYSLRDYGFPAVGSHDITEDPSGAIWVAADTGVFRFAQGRVGLIAKGAAVSVIAVTPSVAVALVGRSGGGLPTTASTLLRMKHTGDTWQGETVIYSRYRWSPDARSGRHAALPFAGQRLGRDTPRGPRALGAKRIRQRHPALA